MGSSLALLADRVGVNERTLRRAVASELVRAKRSGSPHMSLSEGETDWILSHWSLIAQLRACLRTDKNVRLAVLFGSAARGDETAGVSDLDLLVELRSDAPGALGALRTRLNERLSVDVQLVTLDRARRNPRLLVEILRDGRPVIDRERRWGRLRADAKQAYARAARSQGEAREGARAAIDYFQALAARPPLTPSS